MNAQPDNDLFSGRIRLGGTSVSLEAYLLDAALEAGEPDHGPNGGVTAKSVWWTWQAPYSAPVAILSEGESTCDQGVRFYTGAALQRLTPVPEVSPGVVMVSAGQEYQIVLWSRCPSPTADVARFRLETVLGLGVDHFASLSLHSGYGGSERVEWGQTVTATREEPWEPIHGGVARGGSEWWLWQPPTNGLATVTARGVHGFRPIVAAYTGSSLPLLVSRAEPIGDDTWVWPVERDQLYWIASAAGEPGAGGVYRLAAAVSQLVLTSPRAGAVFENPVSVPVSVEGMPVGGTWKIVWKTDRGLSGQVDGVPGSLVLLTNLPRGKVSIRAHAQSGELSHVSPEVAVEVRRPGDRRDDALPLAGDGSVSIGDLGGATTEGDGPGDFAASIWWRWSAPADGRTYVEVRGAPYWEVVEELENGSLQVQALDDATGVRVPAFQARQGRRYLVRAADPFGMARMVSVRLRTLGPPVNDSLTNAMVIPLQAGTYAGNNRLASPDAGEPLNSKSVWFSFVANSDGAWQVRFSYPPTGDIMRFAQVRLFWKEAGSEWWRWSPLPNPLWVTAGSSYLVGVDGDSSTVFDDFSFTFSPFVERARNDRPENATLLQGAHAEFQGDLADASRGVGEKRAGLWWKWVAPRAGLATLLFSGVLPSVEVYRVEPGGGMTRVWIGSPSDLLDFYMVSYLHWRGATFPCQSGVEYRFLVMSEGDGESAHFQALLDVSSARVEVSGTKSPFNVRLVNLDLAVEGAVDRVVYFPGYSWDGESPSTQSPFEATLVEPHDRSFSVNAILVGPEGRIRAAIPALAPPRNDEPETATVLDPWSPRLEGAGYAATFGPTDTGAMRSVWTPERGGGTLWYSWIAPFTGSVVIDGSRGPNLLLFVNYRLLSDSQTIPVHEGARYLFTVAGPDRIMHYGDFGLSFNYTMRFVFPSPREPVVRMIQPTEDQTIPVGASIGFTLELANQPAGFGDLVLLGIGGNQPPSLASANFRTNWMFDSPGIFNVQGAARRKDGSIAGSTVTRTIRVENPNDRFVNRIDLAGTGTSMTVRTALAGLEPLERSLTGGSDARSLWWKWQAPVSGELEIAVEQQFLEPGLVALYSGNELARLVPVAGRERVTPGASTNPYRFTRTRRFPVTGGVEYAIAYEEAGWSTFDVGFRWKFRPNPPNDDFGSATRLPLSGWSEEVSNQVASREWGEPVHAGQFGGRSVWYGWRAPGDGTLRLRMEGTVAAPLLAAYTGQDVGSLSTVAEASSLSPNVTLEFEVAGGREYWVAADGALGATGDFRVESEWSPKPQELKVGTVRFGESGLLVEVEGAAGRPVDIAESRDLIQWQILGTIPPDPDGVVRIQVSVDSESDVKFVRVTGSEP